MPVSSWSWCQPFGHSNPVVVKVIQGLFNDSRLDLVKFKLLYKDTRSTTTINEVIFEAQKALGFEYISSTHKRTQKKQSCSRKGIFLEYGMANGKSPWPIENGFAVDLRQSSLYVFLCKKIVCIITWPSNISHCSFLFNHRWSIVYNCYRVSCIKKSSHTRAWYWRIRYNNNTKTHQEYFNTDIEARYAMDQAIQRAHEESPDDRTDLQKRLVTVNQWFVDNDDNYDQEKDIDAVYEATGQNKWR